jgi:hypothetical protein
VKTFIRFHVDRYGVSFGLFDALFLEINKRAGSTFAVGFDCSPYPPGYSLFKHVNDFYLQVGTIGITLAWKSKRCYQ